MMMIHDVDDDDDDKYTFVIVQDWPQKPFDSIIHSFYHHWGMIEAWLDNKTIASCQNVSQRAGWDI